jgi:predicted small integral membrane protein
MGILPWKTTKGERFFYAIAIMIALGFIGLRFLEEYITMWGVLIISIIIGIIIVKYG